MDWPWCYCFVKETTLSAPTLNLWLTQSVVGVDKSCIFAVFRGILVLWETIYANNDTAKYTAKIDSYISGLLFKYVT